VWLVDGFSGLLSDFDENPELTPLFGQNQMSPNLFIQFLQYPIKNIGDDMKKGIVIIGVIVLVIGLVMMLFLWPMIGTIDSDELEEKIEDGESGTFKVLDEMEEDDWDDMDAISKELAKEMGIDGPGTYVTTVELEDGIPKELTPEWEKVPTMGGILGLVIMIVGIILLIVGAVTGRAAPVAPAQPPMEQPPYQQPPMQQPPYQQPPYQQPPPQQPPMPPPPPR
jgi:hypothetical protein